MAANLPKQSPRRINYILSLLSDEGIKECLNNGGPGAEQYEESKETRSYGEKGINKRLCSLSGNKVFMRKESMPSNRPISRQGKDKTIA